MHLDRHSRHVRRCACARRRKSSLARWSGGVRVRGRRDLRRVRHARWPPPAGRHCCRSASSRGGRRVRLLFVRVFAARTGAGRQRLAPQVAEGIQKIGRFVVLWGRRAPRHGRCQWRSLHRLLHADEEAHLRRASSTTASIHSAWPRLRGARRRPLLAVRVHVGYRCGMHVRGGGAKQPSRHLVLLRMQRLLRAHGAG